MSAALLPYVHGISQPDWQSIADLQRGINVAEGRVEHHRRKRYLRPSRDKMLRNNPGAADIV